MTNFTDCAPHDSVSSVTRYFMLADRVSSCSTDIVEKFKVNLALVDEVDLVTGATDVIDQLTRFE